MRFFTRFMLVVAVVTFIASLVYGTGLNILHAAVNVALFLFLAVTRDD